MKSLLDGMFRAGFIEACMWPSPAHQDVDSKAFAESMSEIAGSVYSGPTHYAVIDEHGEIVQAFKVAGYRNAEFLCKSLIKSMGSHDHDTDDWAVKGVTIHE